MTLLDNQRRAMQAARAGMATSDSFEREMLRLEWHIKFIQAEAEKN